MRAERDVRRYRALLRLLPAELRRRWGRDMEALFRHRMEQAGGSGLRRGVVWIRALHDVLSGAVGERMNHGGGRVTTLLQDLRHALRSLLGAPGLVLTVAATLALGIGAATATFSVLHAVLLRDLPYEEPDRLVMVWPEVNANTAMVALAEEELPSLENVSGATRWTLTLTGAGEPMEITGTRVSTDHFELLGVRPALGRTFRPGEDLPGGAGVAILSHAFWTTVFGADPDILGRTVDIAGAEYDRRTVVGVMPPGHRPVLGETEVWIPLDGDPALSVEEDDSWYVNGRVARLAPGATLERANAEVMDHARRMQARLPVVFDDEEVATASVQLLRDVEAGETEDVLWVAFGAVSLVLLMACANVANLLLVRGEARARDLSVRAALGAGRSRVVLSVLAESGLLGVAGGVLGIVLAYGLVAAVVRLAPPDFPRIDEVGVSGPVLAYALAATFMTTLLAGVVPALRAARVEATASLGGAARGTGHRAASPVSTALVGAQVALAALVAVGSGLMLRSLAELLAVDTGMDGKGVLAFRPNPPGGRYPDGEAFRDYYRRVLERVAAVPGVASVGAIHLLPGTEGTWSFWTYPEGIDIPEGSAVPSVNFRAVRPGYFRTLRIPLRAGRLFDATDNGDADPVVVVNEAFVARFWPGEDPLGRSVRMLQRDATTYRVVGVVADIRQHSRAADPLPEMYYAHDQVPWNQMAMWILVRVGTGEPLDHADAVRAAVWQVDADVPLAGTDDMSAVLGRSTRTMRFLAFLLTSFGLLALALGAVGVFGVTAYTVGRRIPEFGVRIALGSSRTGVLGAAVRRAATPVVVGLLLGLGGAALTSDVLESVLFGVTTRDPLAFGGVAGVLGAVAVLATLLPAWRASRLDPVSVLNRD